MASTSRRNVSNNDEAANDYERESLLNNDSDQDEDTIYNKPGSSGEPVQVHGKMDNIKIQIREVTDVMRDNVQKVMDRGERLEDLQFASDRLNIAGSEFRNSARKARYAAWYRNLVAKFGIIAIIVIIFVIILVTVISKYS
ncbi:synaptobrevin homolog 1-like [Venturia canescens]|uniref:synaptobrevin homolog 1-like n=1 Tax=Venturia canescens TaxID=32260 RepID=UPI001C9CE3B9|nr:synaptobrevin homolog 1-like [Venturia canescens]